MQRLAYPKGTSPRAKNKRAKPVMMRPLAEGPPLRGESLTSKTGLRWAQGLEDVSDSSEGDLEGDEQGEMIPGYSVTWEQARSAARVPTVERVLSQPGLTLGYKQSYIQSGYENMRDELRRRDASVAEMVRKKNLKNRRDLPPLPSPEKTRHSALPLMKHAEGPSCSQLSFMSRDYSTVPQIHSPHSSDFLRTTQYLKEMVPLKEANESQSQYLKRIIEYIPEDLVHDPGAAQALAQLRGLWVPKDCTLYNLNNLGRIRTPGLDPGEQLIEELLPKVLGKQIELTVAVAIIKEKVDDQRLMVTLEKLFTQLPGGYNLAVGCVHWSMEELIRECAKYEAIGRMKNHFKNQSKTSDNKKPSGPPKQQNNRDSQTPDQRQNQSKSKEPKNGARGSPREDPPKQKKQSQKKAEKTAYYSTEDWAALSREQQDEIRAKRTAAKEAQEPKAPGPKV